MCFLSNTEINCVEDKSVKQNRAVDSILYKGER